MTCKRLSVLIFLFSIFSVICSAQDGYRGPGAALVTVSAAKELRDNAPVIIRGNLVKFLGDEKYLLSDSSGSITVEIDDKLWRGFSADEGDLVEITGEIDKDFARVEIEANTIKKVE
ncbi:MAG: NirD/YgiW/YdeI family stress tolerance protein [Deferribacteraceae bacterium]|jgi:uncharacterized protein (TIGR00156 family)|nr:NirD/YgiW/YdeI family stress tolerance protein [Deferribacteraceae bacterium]